MKGMIKKPTALRKGDKVGNKQLHIWLKERFGKAVRCEGKNCTGISKKYEWSNISRKYKRVRSDWWQLCKSCHVKFDMTPQWRKNIRNAVYQEWISRKTCKRIIHKKETRTLVEWAEILKIDYGTLWLRLKKGWSIEKTLTSPKLDGHGNPR